MGIRHVGVGTLALMLAAACSDEDNAASGRCRSNAECATPEYEGTVCVQGLCRAAVATLDAGADTGAVDPKWGCVGKVLAVPVEKSVPVTFPVRFIDPVAKTPRAGLTVEACTEQDRGCTSALMTATTNANGEADMVVYSGFKGFFKVSSASTVTTYIYASPTPDRTVPALRLESGILSEGELEALGTTAGRTLKAGLGHLFFVARDCSGNQADGVSAGASVLAPETFCFYEDETGAPSLALTATNGGGAGGFINLPAGAEAFKFLDERSLLVAERNLVIMPNVVTVAIVPPAN